MSRSGRIHLTQVFLLLIQRCPGSPHRSHSPHAPRSYNATFVEMYPPLPKPPHWPVPRCQVPSLSKQLLQLQLRTILRKWATIWKGRGLFFTLRTIYAVKKHCQLLKEQFQIQPHQWCLFHPRPWKSWKLGPSQVANETGEMRLHKGQQKTY